MLRLPTVMFALAVLFLQLTTPADAAWKAGIAKTSITPDTYMAMSGYGGRDNPADGKLTDLWAKAAVLEDNAGMRKPIEMSGAKIDKIHRIYERRLDGAAQSAGAALAR